MEDALIELLSKYGFPIYRQGSMSDDDKYPESFFTFWNPETADHAHYDNREYGVEWNYNVFFYSTAPELVYSTIESAISDLKSAGWILTGRGYDVNSDEESHTGRGVDITFLDI